jgi:hypothetical protein
MAQPRRSLIKLHDTPYYHVTVRCVRRAWLAGVDASSGKDYSHRTEWMLERIAHLASVFCIDVCAYAIMSNYYEIVLHVDRGRGARLSPEQVIERWSVLHHPPKLIAHWQQGTLEEGKRPQAEHLIEQWRAQLCDLSWFMRCLNEYLARRANAEDGCTGCFWETRFKCRALANDTSLLAALAYVDLSPVRAPAFAPDIPRSTSIQARIERSIAPPSVPCTVTLLDFAAPPANHELRALPFTLRDYVELLDWTAHKIRGEEVAKDTPVPPRLRRLGIDPSDWLLAMRPSSASNARPLVRLQRHSERWLQPRTRHPPVEHEHEVQH